MSRTGTGVLVLGVILGVIGALMYWAVNANTSGFNINTAGLILFWVGVVVAIIGLILALTGYRSTATRREDVTYGPGGQTRYEDEQRRAS
jgi:amino acid transporter